MRHLPTVVALAATALTGCANLNVHQLGSAELAPLTVGEIPYYLPRTTFTIIGTVTLNGCSAEPDGHNGFRPKLDINASLTPIQATEPDPANHYFISHPESRGWMKEINFSVSSAPNGVLQTFNSTINDQVGPDIVAAIGAVVQIGGAVATGGVGVPPHAFALVQGTPDYCPSVRAGLEDIADKKAFIKTQSDHPAADPAGAAAQTQAIQAAQATIDSDIKKYKLTRSVSFKWIPDLSDGVGDRGPFRLLAKSIDLRPVIDEWLAPTARAWLDTEPGPGADDAAKLAWSKSAAPFLATLAVDRRTMGAPESAGLPAETTKISGLVVRDPATAILRLCRSSEADCTAADAVAADNTLVETTMDTAARMVVRLPQFGRKMVLPEQSALFENATLNVALNADGSISTIGYHSVSTLAAGLQGVGTAAGAATTAIAARNTAIASVNTAETAVTTAKTAAVQAPDTYNKALADCLAQQAAILKAGAHPGSCQ